MKKWRKWMLFSLGGTGYMGLELLWRGWSHGSMFLAGGTAFLLLGKLEEADLSLPVKALLGGTAITGVELIAGLVVNRGYEVWDYRSLPFSFMGQICLPYCLAWILLSLPGFRLYRILDARLP